MESSRDRRSLRRQLEEDDDATMVTTEVAQKSCKKSGILQFIVIFELLVP